MSVLNLIDETVNEGNPAEVRWLRYEGAGGGLKSYLSSDHNKLFLRRDIARMYAKYEFVLAPTFRTYLDALHFINSAGVINRDDKDVSPRRPLTGLASPDGLYRYVFIPFTDAARQLENEIGVQPQTEDDSNGGINPAYDRPWHPGSDQYRVVECLSHPFSICTWAEKAFDAHNLGNYITAQWAACASFILEQWRWAGVTVPHWFLDAPKQDDNDCPVYGSEKSGYTLPPVNPVVRTVPRIEDILKYDHSEYPQPREKVLEWYARLKPPFEDPGRALCILRRSARIAKTTNPYARSPAITRRRRKVSPTARAYERCAEEEVKPAWLQLNGIFPTELFSSTEWALFCHGTSLVGKIQTGR